MPTKRSSTSSLLNYFETLPSNDWRLRFQTSLSADQLRDLESGRFAWTQWLTHDSETFPDRVERQTIAAHAERWFQSAAITQWTWMSDAGVSLADQQTLARMIGWNQEVYDPSALHLVNRNPYVLAQLSPHWARSLGASSDDAWWHLIDQLGQTRLAGQPYAAIARATGALVLGLTLSSVNGNTREKAIRPGPTTSVKRGTWLYQVGHMLDPGDPQRGAQQAFRALAALSDGTITDQLPIPYTLADYHTLAVTLTQSQRVAWLAWAGTYWREVAIRDMMLPSLIVPSALPLGWDTVVATPGITWDTAYQRALTSMWDRPVTIVTGAAGTGKTTLIRALALLRQHFAPGVPLILTATTAKAAQRLGDVVRDILTPNDMPLTIHRLLAQAGQWPQAHPEGLREAVGEGWLVVDEASMADVSLLGRVALAMQGVSGHLILVGDAHQLAPVGAGAPFGNLIHTLQSAIADASIAPDRSPVVELTTIFRTHQYPIHANAALLITESDDASSAWQWIQSPDPEALGVFWQDAPTPAARRDLSVAWAQEQQRQQRDWQILTPRRADANALNAALSAAFASDDQVTRTWHLGDRVMQITNDYGLDLVNGQQGSITAMTDTTITAQFSPYDTVVTVDPAYAASHWALAWAITIHKAQGSQWEATAVVWQAADSSDSPSDAEPAPGTKRAVTSPWGRWRISKNLVYTAITRAQNHVMLIVPEDPAKFFDSLRQRPDEVQKRRTALPSLLRKAIGVRQRQLTAPPRGWVEDD